MPVPPASDHRIRGAAIEALGVRCLTAEALADELERTGIDLGVEGVDRLADVLDMSSDFVELESGWLGVAATLDGTRWVTTVDADRAELGVLPLDPDLALLGWWAFDAELTLAGTGQPIVAADDVGDDVLIGPPGWLDAYAGRNVEVHIIGTSLHLAAADGPEVSPEMIAAVRATFDRHAMVEELIDSIDEVTVDLTQIAVEDLLWESLSCDRAAFADRPIPPVDGLIEAAGLVRTDLTVLRAGTDTDALHRWRRLQRLASTYGLEGGEVEWAEVVIGMSLAALSDMTDPLGPPDEVPAAATLLSVALDSPAVCRALLGHHLEAETPPLELAGFVCSVLAHLPEGECAGPRWLEGRALDLGGDPLGAIAAFEAAVATGEEHKLALIALAGFRADAGDAPEAVALLRRAGIESDAEDDADPGDSEAFDLLAEVAGFARHRPRAQAGRNDPCPCGSGRKYKTCHLGKERHDLIDRGPWLYDKAHRYLREHERRLIAMLAGEISASSGRAASMLDLLDSRIVADIALCEGEVGESFVADRDAVLPDDEALLAARWQLVERSLFEVEDVGRAHLRMRDLRTGERITVTNTSPDASTRRGDLMLGRPLPIGDTWRAYSGLVKVMALRDEALAVLDGQDPFEIAELIGRCLAPPTLQNTDGDPMEFHSVVWKVPDPEAARRALDANDTLIAFDRGYQVVRDTSGQRDTVILTLTIEGEELRGEVNSERRADEMIALVSAVIPDAELIDRDFRDLDEVVRTRAASGGAPSPNPLDDPEMADVKEELAAEFERRWLDDHVPALGGLTPREAAVDPIARHDLERLLNSFEGRGGVMDVARLRKALDL